MTGIADDGIFVEIAAASAPKSRMSLWKIFLDFLFLRIYSEIEWFGHGQRPCAFENIMRILKISAVFLYILEGVEILVVGRPNGRCGLIAKIRIFGNWPKANFDRFHKIL